MSNTGFYTHESTFWHSTGVQALYFPIGEWVQPPSGTYGADTPETKRRFLNLLRMSGLTDRLVMPAGEPVTVEDCLRIHPADYIRRFKEASDAGGGDLGMLAPFSKGGFEIALMSAGLARAAIDDVLTGKVRNAYALSRPAGHHCLPDTPMGFCLLANIPIAIEAARARHGIERVAVVDWDVHHGNGTQACYYDRSDVLTISVHQDRCFPPGYSGVEERGEGAGLGHNINIPLPAGSGQDTYVHAFETIVLPALDRYRPDLIVVASGLDANAVDPLARMLLFSESYRVLTGMMMDAADRLCEGRLAVVHEGGYSEAYVPFCGQAIVETLAGVRTGVVDPELEMFALWQPGDRINRFHRELVDEMAAVLLG
uniref:Propanil hydrolase n=2 Tax=Sphingomonas sp. Y57 TaxID=334801 RepID=A0ACD6B8L2_9SPHN|nr:class II histone deacetylase [Sphingomonas sp. Y57]AEO21835.1 propanil hydrolase [Sphingomonas sp. Y57]